jgi:hypothetical protein
MVVKRVSVSVFELPTLLGIPQYVEYEPPPREWCTSESCPHEGVLTAEGCRRGVCVRYRVWVFSWDGERWSAKERWRRRRVEEAGGCLRQQLADALWEVAERGYDVEVGRDCSVAINGVYVGAVSCRAVGGCVEEVLRAYEHAQKTPPKPRRSPEEGEYEELLQRYPLLRFWNKQLVIDALRRSDTRWGLQNLLSRLASIDERVWAFLGRFDLDLRFAIEVYASGEELCVRFYISQGLRIYCHAPGKGWRPVSEVPKFTRYQPLEDSKLAEVYRIGDREFVRIV